MGLICSRNSKQDTLDPLSPRVSPFGRFSRRNSLRASGQRREFVVEGSLLAASLDTLTRTLHLQSPSELCRLPSDLAQLVLNRLIVTGTLKDTTVMLLQGQSFYQLCLDSYHEPIRDFWVRNLITESLHCLDLSRTQIDNFMLSSIPYLSNLRTLRLEYCDGITDAGLIILQRLPALQELSLAGCDGVGPLGLGCIGRVPTLLRLNLDACHKVWGLGPLRSLTALEELDLGYCNAIREEDAAAVASLTTLKSLQICHTEFTDAGVEKLSTLTALTSLIMGGLAMRDGTAAALLPHFPALRKLNLRQCEDVKDGTMRALAAAAPLLTDLNISYTEISDDGLAAVLARLTRLQNLDLESCSVTDDGVKYVSVLKDLRSLDLSDTSITNKSMAALVELRHLTHLNLSFTQVNDWGLEKLAKVTSLRHLNLDTRHVGDKGVGYIATLPHLEVLDLFGSTVTDNGCAVLSKTTTLRSLEVCSGTVTDTGVSHLCALPQLRHLSLSQNWRVSNASIPALMRLSGLTALNLSQCRVTSSAVVTLGCLPDLQVLALSGTRIKPAAVEKLQQMNPVLEVRGVPMP